LRTWIINKGQTEIYPVKCIANLTGTCPLFKDNVLFKDLLVSESPKGKGCDKYIVASKNKNGNYYIAFESLEHGADQPINYHDIKQIKLNFNSKIWIDDWFSLVQKIKKFIDNDII